MNNTFCSLIITSIIISSFTGISAQSTAYDFLEAGRSLQDAQEWEQAAKNYSQALDLNPNLPSANFNRAICFLNLQNFASAKSDLNTLLQEEPSDLDALKMRAFIDFNEKNWLASAQDYSRILEQEESFEIRLNRAIVYLNMNQPELSYQDLIFCQKLNYEDLKLNAVLGDYYLSKNEYLNALTYYKTVLRTDENNFEILNNCGVLEMRNKNYRQAIHYFQKALKLQPDSRIYAHLALAQIQNEDYINATENTQLALSIDSNEGIAHFVQGRLHDKNGNPEKAIESFSKAIGIVNDYLPAFLQRGKANLFIDRTDEAVFDLKKVLEIDPKNEEAKELLESIN